MRMLVFCAYFGHQRIDDLRAMSAIDFRLFFEELRDLVDKVPVVRL